MVESQVISPNLPIVLFDEVESSAKHEPAVRASQLSSKREDHFSEEFQTRLQKSKQAIEALLTAS
jgi:hypothetical protein